MSFELAECVKENMYNFTRITLFFAQIFDTRGSLLHKLI
jgi:hypothetical protein